VFPGNIQGRTVRETGPKGCSRVTVRDGVVTEVRHVPLDVVRWVLVDDDVTGLESPEQVIDRLAERVADEARGARGKLVAARVRAHGRAKAGELRAEPQRWRAELVSRVASVAGPDVWLEKVLFDVQPEASDDPATNEGLAVLEGILAELAASPLGELPEFARTLQAKVGENAPRGDDSPFTEEAMRRARDEAVELLRLRLHPQRGRRA
jgi:exonuclease SbcD